MNEPLKDCGCPVISVRCEHFDDGSSLTLLKFTDEVIEVVNAQLDMDMQPYCIQTNGVRYDGHVGGPMCTGEGHTSDREEALNAFELAAMWCKDHPHERHMLGGFLIEVDR